MGEISQQHEIKTLIPARLSNIKGDVRRNTSGSCVRGFDPSLLIRPLGTLLTSSHSAGDNNNSITWCSSKNSEVIAVGLHIVPRLQTYRKTGLCGPLGLNCWEGPAFKTKETLIPGNQDFLRPGLSSSVPVVLG